MKLYLICNTQATSRVRENRIARGMRAGLAMDAVFRSNDDVLSNLKCTRWQVCVTRANGEVQSLIPLTRTPDNSRKGLIPKWGCGRMGSGLKISRKLVGTKIVFFLSAQKNRKFVRTIFEFLANFGPVWIRPKRRNFPIFFRIGVRHFLLLPRALSDRELMVSDILQCPHILVEPGSTSLVWVPQKLLLPHTQSKSQWVEHVDFAGTLCARFSFN